MFVDVARFERDGRGNAYFSSHLVDRCSRRNLVCREKCPTFLQESACINNIWPEFSYYWNNGVRQTIDFSLPIIRQAGRSCDFSQF